ncbi:DNA recombination protein RmuC [Microbacterium lacticum]
MSEVAHSLIQCPKPAGPNTSLESVVETLAAILAIVNLLLLITVGVLVVSLRPRPAAADLGPVRQELQVLATALRGDLSTQRQELRDTIQAGQQQLEQRISESARVQSEELGRERLERAEAQKRVDELLTGGLSGVSERNDSHARANAASLAEFRQSFEGRFDGLRKDSDARLEQIRATVDEKLQGTLTTSLRENAVKIEELTKENAAKQQEMQRLLSSELEKLRTGNEAKLEKMRETVDEKLQGTLEKRLGESFALVSDRLEQVQKGLGEMQTLASDVGGLKRVLTNVKNRGGWGEVQLSRQLEDILTPGQYEQNVVIKSGTQESVEFAVKLPGRDDEGPVYLPIDSKFPQEDYERLLDAQERGDKVEIDAASKSLERAVLAQAKTIASKYIDPPRSTDFAIMYLPTEGLFAEVVRRPGLASKLQTELRILITGPTTLMSLLNSLQMGFRSLAIEKRSSEVWQVLSAAKTEFQKYGQVWDKLGRQLETAQKTVKEAGVRTRAVERKLRDVEVTEIEVGDESLATALMPTSSDAVADFDQLDPDLAGVQ